jgi:hypothetical protein
MVLYEHDQVATAVNGTTVKAPVGNYKVYLEHLSAQLISGLRVVVAKWQNYIKA